MNQLHRYLLCGLVMAAFAPLSNAAEDDNWYQVEVIVFNYLSASQNHKETWPALPVLAYPTPLRQLQTRAPYTDASQANPLLDIETASPALTLDLAWDKSIAKLWQEYQLAQNEVLPETGSPLLPAELEVPTAFAQLDAAQLEFNSEISRIKRSPDMHLLFHGSWRQPLRERALSLPLLVDSDEAEGEYPTLQGSILLYVSRYLHVETELWLNRMEATAETSWTMPQPPLAPAPYLAEGWSFKIDPSALALEPASASDILQPITVSARHLGASALQDLMQEPYYEFKHAVAVKHKRRMRSGEIHYLDHPLLGVIIKVTPYEFEAFFDPAKQLSPALVKNN